MMNVLMCQKRAEAITIFLNQYKWLLDSYVIEFFTEHHWGKLPLCWQEALNKVTDIRELGHILLHQSERCCEYNAASQDICCSVNQVYPLSLLAFAATAKAHSLPRHPHSSPQQRQTSIDHPTNISSPSGGTGCSSQVAGIEHRYRRHVKPKKQHEIKCLAEVVSKVAKETNCQNVIDVGSGQGHLARFLAYNYGLDVSAIEAVGEHLTAAAKFDGEIEKEKAKQSERRKGKDEASVASEDLKCQHGTVTHIQSVIKPGCSIMEFLSQAGLTPPISSTVALPASTIAPPTSTTSQSISTAQMCSDKESEARHVLIGLHTCGDLGATMMRVFRESEEIAGLISLGCCYMKLSCRDGSCNDYTSSSAEALGYPLSEFVGSLLPGSSLSYEAREVSCHSIDAYSKYLQPAGERELALDHLKIHCHRAAMETVLRKNGMKRAQVRISKRVSKCPFPEYAKCLVESVGLPTLREDKVRQLSLLVEQDWRKVATFFMLRLAMAPCVESLILLDRAIFLTELNTTAVRLTTHKPVQVHLVPIFDPRLSPRNIALIASRISHNAK